MNILIKIRDLSKSISEKPYKIFNSILYYIYGHKIYKIVQITTHLYVQKFQQKLIVN